ncbi:hypothetical protein Mapa_000008 [Marchantia paleacea]|nr:hypothetical protein Mapa_000008 [Marchantia paleacea]
MDVVLTARSWLRHYYVEIIAAGAALVAALLFRSFRNGYKLPPGPPKWPVVGHLLSLSKTEPAHQTFTKFAEQYGPIILLQLGAFRTAIVASADLEKEILETQDHIFASRSSNIFSEVVLYGEDMIFAPLGDRFRKLRKICVVELLNAKRLSQFEDSRKDEVLKAVKRTLGDGRGGNPVRFDLKLSEMSFNIMTRMMFTKVYYGQKMYKSEKDDQESTDFHRLMATVTSVSTFGIGDCFPWLRKFDFDGYEKQMKGLRFQFDSFLNNVIAEHRQQSAGTRRERMDFVDVLLQLQSDKTNEAHGVSDDVVKALLIDMLIGGTDTATNSILWAMAMFMRYPEVLKKLQDELKAVVGMGRVVEEADLESLLYFKAFCYECLRMHPGAPVTVPHTAVKDTKLGGYDIPENTRVIVNIYAINRDPKVWPKPLEFNPDRFLNSHLDHKGKHFQFRPFGTGRRMCPGMNLAMILFQLTLAQLLHTCNFSLPSGMKPEDVNLDEKFSATTQMAHPLEVIVTPRISESIYM